MEHSVVYKDRKIDLTLFSHYQIFPNLQIAISPTSLTSDLSQMSTAVLYCVESSPLPSSCYIIAATPQAAAIPIHI